MRPLTLARIERGLRAEHGADAPALTICILAAVVGRTSHAVRIRLRSRRCDDLSRVLQACRAAVPEKWLGKPASAQTRMIMLSESDADKSDPIQLDAATKEPSQIQYGIIAEKPTNPPEGVLDLELDDTCGQTLYLAKRLSNCATADGQRRLQHFERFLEEVRSQLAQLPPAMKVVLPGTVRLPDLPVVPAHLPDAVRVVQNLAIAQACLESAGQVPPDGVVRAQAHVIEAASHLLVRAGARDHSTQIPAGDLMFLAWLDVMDLGSPPLTIDEIADRLRSPQFHRDLHVVATHDPDLRIYPQNQVWQRQHVERPLKRLWTLGCVSRDESRGQPYRWARVESFRGYRGGVLYRRIAESTAVANSALTRR